METIVTIKVDFSTKKYYTEYNTNYPNEAIIDFLKLGIEDMIELQEKDEGSIA